MTDYSGVSVEKLLKYGYKKLYDDKEPEVALATYANVLERNPNNIKALVYKAASLEKLYFGNKDKHTANIIDEANECLSKALVVAQGRGDRELISFVYFRLFVHYFNRKMYQEAGNFFQLAKDHDYQDATMSMWEQRLNKKLAKLKSEEKDNTVEQLNHLKLDKDPVKSFKVDWYQTPNNVTISLFTETLPSTVEDIIVNVSSNNRTINVSYPIVSKGSEFQYNVTLSNEIVSTNIQCKKFTKKIEIVFEKLQKRTTWHNLSEEQTTTTDKVKGKDWSKIIIDDKDENDNDEEDGSADSFFQKIYADADPDTRRAMMKSFIESNGTTLNTSWDDVKEDKVETVPPEGSELKHY
ncbi:hypothetical protein C6P45_002816 [Maudiozyma exigua]|uniref:CS domain-containing protein n=1 Tax=Maudiozyma exigua TaxID=34358 RepID=A0A9P7B2V7_MAUEX|nr:hypothetical protein C6P45_002816 [Kazachstania exigua]